jgi:hypothetical protein
MLIFFLQKCGEHKPNHDLTYNVDVRLYKKVCEFIRQAGFRAGHQVLFPALMKFHDFSGK